MTNEDQIKAFDRLATNLRKVADRFNKEPELFNLFTKEEWYSPDDLYQAALLAEDHKKLAELWDAAGRSTHTGEFITLEKAADISQNYINRFGTGTSVVVSPVGQRLPLFPDIMWFVSADRLRDVTNLKTKNSATELIRIYPGINMPNNESEYFTFVFAAEDIHQKLITHNDMDDASKRKMIDKDGNAASALEEIGTCRPCDQFIIQRPNANEKEQQTS